MMWTEEKRHKRYFLEHTISSQL